MKESNGQTTLMAPQTPGYLKGAPPESRQFDFLIGDWDVAGTRYGEDGSTLLQYQASWSARYLNEGRMVMDDFKVYAPDGAEISSFVTLRTYSAASRRWEMAGLAALQPAANAEWHGEWQDGEMQLIATGKSPDGKAVSNRIRFFDIENDRFAWESRMSRDSGESWIRAASLLASRRSR